MNVNEIRELAQIVRENELTALEVTLGEERVRIERQSAPATPAAPAAAWDAPPATAPAPIPADPGVDFNDIIEVKSPMVGVFYAAPAPDADPFVKVGSAVKKGDVLCIIEAMKLMNELASEVSGKIVDICVQNGDVVEFGQTLFKLY